MTWWADDVLDRERFGPLIEEFLGRIVLAKDRDRLPHAVMLVGPPGLGRELAAVEAAILMVCAGADAPWSESGCSNRIRGGLHPDVSAVRPQPPAEIIKIAQVREVVDSAPARPYEGRCRIWIFDGVEAGRFGAGAANAFLKMLEEPPEHVRFLLLAANPAAVLPTVRSRCQLLSLPGPLALAAAFDEAGSPELLASRVGGQDVATISEQVREALGTAIRGDVRRLVGLSSQAPDGAPIFEIVAATAVDMASEDDGGRSAEELVRLAAELARVERRTRGLNLDTARQLTACLVGWFRGLSFE